MQSQKFKEKSAKDSGNTNAVAKIRENLQIFLGFFGLYLYFQDFFRISGVSRIAYVFSRFPGLQRVFLDVQDAKVHHFLIDKVELKSKRIPENPVKILEILGRLENPKNRTKISKIPQIFEKLLAQSLRD